MTKHMRKNMSLNNTWNTVAVCFIALGSLAMCLVAVYLFLHLMGRLVFSTLDMMNQLVSFITTL